MVYNFFEKKSKGSCVANNEIKQNRLPLDLATNQLLKIKKKEQFIRDLKTIFGVLI